MLSAPVRFALLGSVLTACASSADVPSAASEVAALTADAGSVDETEVPPVTDSAAIDGSIAKGYFLSWACDPAIRPSRQPGGTAPTRVCNNAKARAHGAGEYPAGATLVRELYDANQRLIGHAMITKVAAGGGNAWYWFEHRESGLVASGLGDSGQATLTCVRCHERANPSTLFGHDLVFNHIP